MDGKEMKAAELIVAAQMAAGVAGPITSIQVPNPSGPGLISIPVKPSLDGSDPGQRAKVQLMANLVSDFLPWVQSILADTATYPDPTDPYASVAVPGTQAGVLSLLGTVAKAALVAANPTASAGISAAIAALGAVSQAASAAGVSIPTLAPISAPAPRSPATPAQPAGGCASSAVAGS